MYFTRIIILIMAGLCPSSVQVFASNNPCENPDFHTLIQNIEPKVTNTESTRIENFLANPETNFLWEKRTNTTGFLHILFHQVSSDTLVECTEALRPIFTEKSPFLNALQQSPAPFFSVLDHLLPLPIEHASMVASGLRDLFQKEMTSDHIIILMEALCELAGRELDGVALDLQPRIQHVQETLNSPEPFLPKHMKGQAYVHILMAMLELSPEDLDARVQGIQELKQDQDLTFFFDAIGAEKPEFYTLYGDIWALMLRFESKMLQEILCIFSEEYTNDASVLLPDDSRNDAVETKIQPKDFPLLYRALLHGTPEKLPRLNNISDTLNQLRDVMDAKPYADMLQNLLSWEKLELNIDILRPLINAIVTKKQIESSQIENSLWREGLMLNEKDFSDYAERLRAQIKAASTT